MQLTNKVKHNGAVKTERIPFAARRCRLSTNCPAVRTSYLSADNKHSLPACSHKHHCTWFHRLCSNRDFDIISIAFAASEISTSFTSPLSLCSTRDFNKYTSLLQHQRFQHHTHRLCSTRDVNIHRLCSTRDFNIIPITFAAPEISISYPSSLQHQGFQPHIQSPNRTK